VIPDCDEPVVRHAFANGNVIPAWRYLPKFCASPVFQTENAAVDLSIRAGLTRSVMNHRKKPKP
jgi:hypothetical protein